MPGKQRIDLYCLCWNDARMLPFFFRHYDDLVDKYFVFDNGSTDESLSLLRHHGRVEVTHFDTPGDSFALEEVRLCDTIWQGSEADWVIVTDLDEHIYRPELREYLQKCTKEGITAIQSIGYEMVSDTFPTGEGQLCELVTKGARGAGFDRLCVFNPRAITATNYTLGRHAALPTGHVVFPDYPEVLLLHYKQLGLEYLIARSAELLTGLKSKDIQEGWGVHYTWSPEKIAQAWRDVKAFSGPVPGLGELRHIEPEDFGADERLVAKSGTFDEKWYLTTYPDVAEADIDPLAHYNACGWKEGRKPNFYFEPELYCEQYSETLTPGRNPLCDYLDRGEKTDARPSPRFDTSWYRSEYGLDPDESPLGHYLGNRKSGRVSPSPNFDVLRYCREHPKLLRLGKDPFEEYSRESAEGSKKNIRKPRHSRASRRATSAAENQ